MRTKAELVKLAILLGRIAVGRWQNWDLVKFPPAALLDRLRIREVEQIVRQTRSDVSRLAQFHPGGKPIKKKAPPPRSDKSAAYCNFTGHDTDLVKEFLPALGLELRPYSTTDLRQFNEPEIANCLGIEAAQFAVHRADNISTIITDAARCDAFAHYAPTVGLPTSFGRLRDSILSHATQVGGESLPIPSGTVSASA
jgi:hypothetical protein